MADKQMECARLAMIIGWRCIDTLEGLQEIGVPDAVHGQSVWLEPIVVRGETVNITWHNELPFDPWVDANDDLLLLRHFQDQAYDVYSDYKDCLYHEQKGHGTHNVWSYYKGKFANASIMLLNR